VYVAELVSQAERHVLAVGEPKQVEARLDAVEDDPVEILR
jgi:hypothetical protein